MEFDTQLKKSLVKKPINRSIAFYADEISEIWKEYHQESCD